LQYLLNSGNQLRNGNWFRQGYLAGRVPLPRFFVTHKCREENRTGVPQRRMAPQLRRHMPAIFTGHVYVEEYKVRMKFEARLDRVY